MEAKRSTKYAGNQDYKRKSNCTKCVKYIHKRIRNMKKTGKISKCKNQSKKRTNNKNRRYGKNNSI